MATAIALNSLGGVRMLLDFKADPNLMEGTGNRPLQSALDMEHFRVAELLLDHGSDPWAIDGGGGNFGSSLDAAMLTRSGEEEAARNRLRVRRTRLGWPAPAPSPTEVRALALAGKWPPANARAKPVPVEVLALIRKRAERDR
jgi:ankyrin repeat protein